MNFDFERKTKLTEEAMDMATEAFIQEARDAGMTCTKIDNDMVNISHDDAKTLIAFVEQLDVVKD